MLDSLLSWNFVSSAVLVPSPEFESKALAAAQIFQQHFTEWAHIPLLNFHLSYQFYSNRLFTRLQYFFFSFLNLILILKKVQYEYCQWIWFRQSCDRTEYTVTTDPGLCPPCHSRLGPNSPSPSYAATENSHLSVRRLLHNQLWQGHRKASGLQHKGTFVMWAVM